MRLRADAYRPHINLILEYREPTLAEQVDLPVHRQDPAMPNLAAISGSFRAADVWTVSDCRSGWLITSRAGLSQYSHTMHAAAQIDNDWDAPAAATAVHASIPLPGSKSITNRALILAALAAGPTTITGPLRARDTGLM